MPDQMTGTIAEVVRQSFPDAHDVSITQITPLSGHVPSRTDRLQVAWQAAGNLHTGQFVVKQAATTDGEIHEGRVLRALQETAIPTPQVYAVNAEAPEPFIVMEHLPGQPLATALQAVDMRWQLSALAFTFARMLARIHRLAWPVVAPWMADPEDLPEDLVDAQIDEMWETWQARIAALPPEHRQVFEQALAWLDLRRPVEVSVCLCHGGYSPEHILLQEDEVSGVVGWRNARVTDAAYDLALLPTELRRLGLPAEDVELFAQATHGAYLQSASTSLGNLPFFTVARLLDEALDAVEVRESMAEEATAPAVAQQQATGADADARLLALEYGMATAARVPWRA